MQLGSGFWGGQENKRKDPFDKKNRNTTSSTRNQNVFVEIKDA
jgi:hypothetical protein